MSLATNSASFFGSFSLGGAGEEAEAAGVEGEEGEGLWSRKELKRSQK